MFPPTEIGPQQLQEAVDQVSVMSSPARHAGAQQFSLSPQGQRSQKIPKTSLGSVHFQVPPMDAPVPNSPRSGEVTPIPTEKADSDEGGELLQMG